MNQRGQYGVRIGADAPAPSRSLTPWLIGGGLAIVGLAVVASQANRPRLTPLEKEMRAWNREYPSLPWFQDEVKDSEQLDLWERARDHWEKTH